MSQGMAGEPPAMRANRERKASMALWSGRFEEGADAFTQRFGASLPVDRKLYAQDIAGSKAHAAMLAAQGVISDEDAQAITKGLDGIQADIEAGAFSFDVNDEDIHICLLYTSPSPRDRG